MIHVVIPVHNRLPFTIKCISSLRLQKTYEKLNIIVVDDGSVDGTGEYLKKNLPEVYVLKGNGNLFWTGAVCYAIDYVLKISKKDDWVLLVTNDVEMDINCLSELIRVAKNKNRMSLVGALTVKAQDRDTIVKSGSIVESWFFNKTKHIHEGLKLSLIKKKNNPIKVDFITGRCLLHPIEIFLKAGSYCKEELPHYGADDEFSIRIKKYGFSNFVCMTSIVYLEPNITHVKREISLKYLFETLFSIRSSSNIINKFRLTLKIVPLYAKATFFMIGVIKSFYIFFKKNDY
jgi:glycosyltransferase involved in cell wall biosynthesis